MNDPITFGSVCSGIEAASVAWNPLGWRAAWLAEIDPFPSAVLAHHYPDVPNLGDMTKLAAMIRAGQIEAPDVFCGGTPCQAFSVAGLRRSLDDARGNLSLTFCEIANELDTARSAAGKPPCVFFWENVPGVLSTSDNAFGCFLAGLAGEADALVPEPCPPAGKSSRYWKWSKATGTHSLGWPVAGCVIGPTRTVAWRVLDAQYFGVAQRRRRVFVVASARTGFDPAAVLFEFDGVRRDSAPRREAREGVTHDIAPCLTSSGRGVERTGDTRGQDPVVAVALRGRDGGATAELGDNVQNCLRASSGGGDKPHVLAPVAFGGNNQSGPIDVATARNACASASGRMDFETETFLVQQTAHTLRGEGFDASEDGTGRGTPLVPVSYAVRTANTNANGHGISPELAHTLDQAQGQCVAFDTTQVTSATNRSNPQPGDPCHPLAAGAHAPAIAFQGRGSNIDLGQGVTGTIGTNADRASGGAPCIAFSAKDYGADAGSISPTLRAMGHAGSHANGGGQMAVAYTTKLHNTQSNQAGKVYEEYATSLDANSPPPAVFAPVAFPANLSGTQHASTEDLAPSMGAKNPTAVAFAIQAGAIKTNPSIGPDGVGVRTDDCAYTIEARAEVQAVAFQDRFRGDDGRGYDRPPPMSTEQVGTLETVKPWNVATAMQVRRLTPRECERLQGFPDDYTLIPWRKKPASECPDGPRYKALGNSWAVPNVRWIGRRIDAAMRTAA